MKSFKEYLGLPTISVGGLDSYHPIADLGDKPPKGKGSRDRRATALNANYDTQAPGTMKPMLTASAKKLQQTNWKDKGHGPYRKEDKDMDKFLKDIANNTPNSEQFDEAVSLNDIKSAAQRFAKGIYDKLKRIVTTKQRYEYVAKVLQDVIDRKKKERAKEGLPLRHDIGYYSAAVADTFKDIDPKKLVKMVHEASERVPRKPGQPAGSDKHSDLYTDENPKGTIQGLGFTDAEKARESVTKIKNSGKSHAHKIQAAIAMGQRAKVASERAKDPKKKKDLAAAHRVYQSFIDTNKKKD